MTDHSRKQTIDRVKQLFTSFKKTHGEELSPEKVLEVVSAKFQRDCKEHIERTIADVSLKTLMDTISILKKKEYLIKDTPKKSEIMDGKKATRRKPAKKRAVKPRVQS